MTDRAVRRGGDLTPDAVGTWLSHCHVADHIAAGMQTRYEVTGA